MMSAKHVRALELYARQLDRRASDASRQYAKLRETFGEYYFGEGSDLLMSAARATDSATRAASDFRARLVADTREVAS